MSCAGEVLHAPAEKWIGTGLVYYKVMNGHCGGCVDEEGGGAVYFFMAVGESVLLLLLLLLFCFCGGLIWTFFFGSMR